MSVFFWKNLNTIKALCNLSFADISDDLNAQIPGLGYTKSKLDYNMRYLYSQEPPEEIIQAVNNLYCNGLGCDKDTYNILDHELTFNQAAYLVTNKAVDECSDDKSEWIQNFWSSYQWVEFCFGQMNQAVPAWSSTGKHSYKLRKDRSILPAVPVLKEFAATAGINEYPIIYLSKLSGPIMLQVLANILIPDIKRKETVFQQEEHMYFDSYEVMKSCRGMKRDVAKIEFLAAYGFLSEEELKTLNCFVTPLAREYAPPELQDFEKTGKSYPVEFRKAILQIIQDAGPRLEKAWSSRNP